MSGQILDSEDENLIPQKRKNLGRPTDLDEDEDDYNSAWSTSKGKKKRLRLTTKSQVQTPKSDADVVDSTVASNAGDEDDGESEVENDSEGDKEGGVKKSKVSDVELFRRWFM